MKKILMISAAMAAVLSSCSKSEIDTVSNNDGKDMILNISVSNPGVDTKALIKTDWTTDDEISIWYDTNTDATPDLVITYNGTKWIQKTGASISGSTPEEGEGKYAKALYNGTVKVASKDTYTYENNTLTFNIANWVFLTEVQVVVKGLTGGSAANYTLACDKFTPITGNGYTVGAEAITVATGTKRAAVTGISNTDGVAFVFATAEYSTTTADYKFVLTDNTSTPAVKTVYTAQTNKISGTSGSMISIKALTIANTSFYDPVIPEFVGLGLTSGLEWRSWNLGASNPEEYGDYYAWGATELAYRALSSNTFTFKDSRPTSYGGTGWNSTDGFKAVNTPYYNGTAYVKYKGTGGSGDNRDKLETTDDAAYKSNNSWRMPTAENFVELFNECYAEWGTYKSVNGLIVYKAKSAEDKGYAFFHSQMNQYSGSSNTWNTITKTRPSYSTDFDTFVFFPAAGYGSGTSLRNVCDYGYYWSSTLSSATSASAYYLCFFSSDVYPQYGNGRYYGYPVRPVSD